MLGVEFLQAVLQLLAFLFEGFDVFEYGFFGVWVQGCVELL